MVKKIIALYLISFLICPAAAIADEAESAPLEYDVISIKAGEPAPFDGVLLTLDAAAKIVVDKKFENTECDLRIGYELHIQEQRYQLQLDYKDIEIASWKDKHESMMILKTAENSRLEKLILKQNPTKEPWLVALGFGIGTLTSLGIFALSTEIVK
jgi:hypothetical protein